MLIILLIMLVAALLAPTLTHRLRLPRKFLALVPAFSFIYCLWLLPAVKADDAILSSWHWMPSLGLSLSFFIDGLSLFFLLLITGIGTFIVLYASTYLKDHADEGRFFLWLFLFMMAMTGLVASDNLLSLFVFWELTSITSYMLIGFHHESEKSRKLALQGLFVTAAGGLLLMTGFIMLGMLAGTYQLSEITTLSLSDENSYITTLMVLILLGAFTKSAQFPFHFWLPNAMAAPTPVSAFLHSATMVKAGIFLMARLHPTFSEQAIWSNAQIGFGAITMLLGAWLAFLSTDLKKVLAYSTVMALGTLTFLLGIGTDYALTAFITYLFAHSLYKASLFMLAGGIDHSTGTKDLLQLQGLRSSMPVTFVLVIVAALSLAGLPPMLGFIGKELLLEASLGTQYWAIAAVLITAVLVVAVAITLISKPFFGEAIKLPKSAHELPFTMLAGPVVLLMLSLVLGLMPTLAQEFIVHAAVSSVSGSEPKLDLKLWHGINTALMMSVLSLIGGSLLAIFWLRSRGLAKVLWQAFGHFGPEKVYFSLMAGIVWFSSLQTRLIQNGRLGIYMCVLILATLSPIAWILVSSVGLPDIQPMELTASEWVMAALIVVSSVFAIVTRSRFASIISLGALGFAVALIFVHFSAPDLGITQVLVETLTVLLLVLVLVRVPGFVQFSSCYERVRDAAVAIFAGVVMAWVMLVALPVQWAPSISSYFVDNSYTLGKGKNIVNVILVDFRALDTLGEVFVLAIAALGVYSMLKLRRSRHGENQASH